MSLMDKIFLETTGKNKVVKVTHGFGVFPKDEELVVHVSTNAGDATPPENTSWWIKIEHDERTGFAYVPVLAEALEGVFYEYTDRMVEKYVLESEVHEGGITHTLRITAWGEVIIDDREE